MHTAANITANTQAGLVFTDESFVQIETLSASALEALACYGYTANMIPTVGFDTARIEAGPLAVDLELVEDHSAHNGLRVNVSIERLRDSETLHPEAQVAVLAEILSLMIEQTGAQTVAWDPANITMPATRFQTAFTPIRLRKDEPQSQAQCAVEGTVVPRRVRPGHAPVPMTPASLIASMPKDVPLGLQTSPDALADDLAAVFREKPKGGETTVETPISADLAQDNAEAADSPLEARLAAWTVTAAVGVLNPPVAAGLATYNLLKGEDFRISTHALTLTAALFGLGSSMAGFLPFL
jgi:hypothetical protein